MRSHGANAVDRQARLTAAFDQNEGCDEPGPSQAAAAVDQHAFAGIESTM
jgi:hypothetical protein